MPVMRVGAGVELQPRDPNDFYPTHPKVCNTAVQLLPQINRDVRIIDPGAGTGVWGEAARLCYPNAEIVGIDVRELTPNPAYTHWITGDFRLINLDVADMVIGNPPFKYAESFVRVGISLVKPRNGIVLYLLPLNFLAGEDRRIDLFATYPPSDVYILSLRPSFIHKGKKAGNTDATEYAIYMWDFSRPRQTFPNLHWLGWKRNISHRQLSLI